MIDAQELKIESKARLWKKHDETAHCPTATDAVIEVETWAAKGSFTEVAENLDWRYVKFYREIPAKK